MRYKDNGELINFRPLIFELKLDYILGAQGRSFLVGYGKNYPDRPHHRAASCSLVGECGWDAYKNDVPNPQVLLGALGKKGHCLALFTAWG